MCWSHTEKKPYGDFTIGQLECVGHNRAIRMCWSHTEKKPYGDFTIGQLECVGHIQKRSHTVTSQ